MPSSPQQCAHKILEVTPLLLQAIRNEMRRLNSADLTVPTIPHAQFPGTQPRSVTIGSCRVHRPHPILHVDSCECISVERDLVERRTDSDDRRHVHLTVTRMGRTMLQSALQVTEAKLALLVANLSSAERDTVVAGLELLRPVFLPSALFVQKGISPEVNDGLESL